MRLASSRAGRPDMAQTDTKPITLPAPSASALETVTATALPPTSEPTSSAASKYNITYVYEGSEAQVRDAREMIGVLLLRIGLRAPAEHAGDKNGN